MFSFIKGSAVDLELLKSLNIGRRTQQHEITSERSRRSVLSLEDDIQRRHLGSFEEKIRLVQTIFNLQLSEKCEDILLCDLLLAEATQPAAEALTYVYAGCQRLLDMRKLPQINCDVLIAF
jgi:hypothetical protein